jgi:hypothetical protein
MNSIDDDLRRVDLLGYESDISYCGSWSLNSFRSRIGVHRLLPFNRSCYLHDKGYSILTKHFHKLNLFQFLKYKFIIDYKFLMQMRSSESKKHSKVLHNVTAPIFFTIVILMTPIYYFRIKKVSKQ